VPRVLDDAGLLGQDLDEPVGLPLAEHHAPDRGHQGLVGQVEGGVGRIHRLGCQDARAGRELTL